MSRPKILVTNDDGITSRGIALLVRVAAEFGDVTVLAPDSPQSAMGHAITIAKPLRLTPVTLFSHPAYECSGTPADCVKLAKHFVFKDQKPDLVLSGMNHGHNGSISILYSGTMSAAIEAAIENIPAIGFSLCDYDPTAYLEHVVPYMRSVIAQALERGLSPHLALNVNFPAYDPDQPLKGLKICRQAQASWEEKFDERKDPHGRSYFWMAGDFVNHDQGSETDEWALTNGYVSVVPCQYDLTAYHALRELDSEWSLQLPAEASSENKP